MTILALKLVLTPLLIAVASFVQRRFGGRVGGLIAGLPLTSAPVSVFISLEYGSGFAASPAVATLLGVVAMSGFCTAYALCARRVGWLLSLVLAAFTCAAITVALSRVPQNLVLSAAIAFPSLLLLIVIIGQAGRQPNSLQPAWWDTPARMIVAAAAVVVITGVADIVGPTWSGLLATLPIFAAVMGVFSHWHAGPQAANAVLRGIAVGSLGAAAFFLVVGALLTHFDDPITYTVAVSAAVVAASASHFAFTHQSARFAV